MIIIEFSNLCSQKRKLNFTFLQQATPQSVAKITWWHASFLFLPLFCFAHPSRTIFLGIPIRVCLHLSKFISKLSGVRTSYSFVKTKGAKIREMTCDTISLSKEKLPFVRKPKVWGKKAWHVQNFAINKNSIIFVQSLWNFVKMIISGGDYFHQVSWGSDKKCGFLLMANFWTCRNRIFFPQTLHKLFFKRNGVNFR